MTRLDDRKEGSKEVKNLKEEGGKTKANIIGDAKTIEEGRKRGMKKRRTEGRNEGRNRKDLKYEGR
jgi:hypothetical protein